MEQSELLAINMALDIIDEQAITSAGLADPSTTTEELAARHKDVVRRKVLRKHPWNFATKRALLTALAVDVPFGDWDNWYNLPSDFIRFAGIGEFLTQSAYHQIEDNKILIKEAGFDLSNGALPLRYVYDHSDFPKWDPLAFGCYVLELAMSFSGKITGKNSYRKDIESELSRAYPEAFAVDGQDVPPKKVSRSRILDRRRGAGTVGYGRNNRYPF